jgi:hypothetical protein
VTNPRSSPNNPSASTEKPEELRELADQDRSRQPVHVTDHRRLRDQVGDEAQLAYPREQGHPARQKRERRAERDGALRIPVRRDQRKDRGGDHRSERGVRPEHEDPRRAEERVPQQAEDRGVQAGDRGQPGQLGVGHALRHKQRGQDQAGDGVTGQPTRPVGAK